MEATGNEDMFESFDKCDGDPLELEESSLKTDEEQTCHICE